MREKQKEDEEDKNSFIEKWTHGLLRSGKGKGRNFFSK